jgi:hypothetical protein
MFFDFCVPFMLCLILHSLVVRLLLIENKMKMIFIFCMCAFIFQHHHHHRRRGNKCLLNLFHSGYRNSI